MKLRGLDYQLKTRFDEGFEVLDGDQKCVAYLSLGPQFEDSEERVWFRDGTLLSVVIESMDEEAEVLLQDSRVEYGWRGTDEGA